jgi:hypothetical protein
MTVKRRSSMTQVLAGLAVVIVALVVVAVTPEGGARRSVTPPVRVGGRALGSMFQDDQHLIYSPTPVVTRTLNILQGLGVDQIRATVVWKDIAPNATSPTAPARFNATDPASYPAAVWAPYDRLDELVRARGMTLNLNVTAPAPLWAVARGASSPHYADHWIPAGPAFGHFVRALGTRYSGRYVPPGGHAPLPRVSFWSIWNEPNQPGWLAPQWRTSPHGPEMESPVLYRSAVDAAFAALSDTGHGPSTDTVLVGDLAPEGCVAGEPSCQGGVYPRPEWPIAPLPFLRGLYCVGPSDQPLRGSAAAALGCPRSPDAPAFVAAHPGLFRTTGFAHHPYSFLLAPNLPLPNPAFVPLSNLRALEASLDAIFKAYGVNRRLPIYLTEYGYETNPPNPFKGVAPQLQARFLNQAEYLAWKDPRVMTLNQFLLYDSPPNRSFPRGSPGYWSTFQTGLLYADGKPKPSLGAYRLPIYLPRPALGSDRRVLVWAMLRDAPRGSRQRAEIQWRPSAGGPYRTLEQVTVADRSEVLTDTVRVPAAGQLRVQWTSPAGQRQDSRAAAIGAG